MSMRWFIAAVFAFCVVGCASTSGEEVKVAQAEYGLANDAFGRASYREALDHIDRALEADDRNTDALYLGAMVYLVFCANDGDSPDCRYEQAEEHIRRVIEIDPEMRDAVNVLGVILVHQGKPSEAATVLEPLSKDILYRSPEKAWGNLGWAYLEHGSVDKAIPALKRAIAAQPLFCVGHYRLGLAYEKKREYAAARQAFTRAVEIEHGACQRLQAAYWGRARMGLRLGDELASKQDLEKCRELAAISDVGKKCARSLQTLQ